MSDLIDAAVIVPTTGRRPILLRRALASVLAQLLRPREILVIVAAAEDAVPDVAAQTAGLPCTVLAVGDSRGAGATRNHGARVARAHHLCFLDDDDVWKPGYLAAVFADGPAFDLALTAFEKHSRDGVRPEKVPPETLDAGVFLVANPGLRGSNLVVTRELFWAAGGFSESLPSFNDMDFGLRLVAAQPRRYRRILTPLVEYHAHDGERLSRRGAQAIPPGLEGFLQLHGPRMDHRQEAAFRTRAIDLWGVDPWAPAALERRLQQALAAGTIAAHFPGLLHAAETALIEETCCSDTDVDARQAFIDRLCEAFERDGAAPRLRSLRIVVITTDTAGSVAALLASLQRALERSRWRASAGGPLVELLFVRNDRDPEIDDEHGATLRTWADPRIVVAEVHVPRSSRPLSLCEARAFAFRAACERGWEPSPDAPVWSLDEDFRFEVLVPSVERGFRRVAGGALLHRLELLALGYGPSGIDALVGGNSGAAPVPALGLLRRQLFDLTSTPAPGVQTSERGRRLAAWLRRRDPYYDLTTDRGEELWMPLRAAWWRESGEWAWDEVVERLMLGLPVTRPALPSLDEMPPTAWGHLDAATVAGGNTVLFTPRVLRADAFVQVRWGSVRSRRGDTTWCINCRKSGAMIARASIPLLHDRAPRRGAPARETTVRDAVADALGVGLYETLGALGRADQEATSRGAGRRLAAVIENLAAATAQLEAPETPFPPEPRSRLLAFLRDVAGALKGLRLDEIETSDPQDQERSSPMVAGRMADECDEPLRA
ncbi:family 2 glycosyl transferase [Sorangium cellulosum]|uniref:Family 2 glycosyl transferase n=1 Tax=Sorangium cellulosum TaxID=56 RepID=A0A150NYJ4_SORCE|nr:family 2 glycosyl transferase [Sorangium cellulosum]